MEMSAHTELRIYNVLFAFAAINFFAFVFVALAIGGDAVNGYSSNGHFFLKNHGRITEVSEAVFTYSKWHVYCLWVSWGAAFIASFRHRYLKKRGHA